MSGTTPRPPIVPTDAAGIAAGACALREGALVAMPTETVYGLAGDATNATAVARIFSAKGRPSFNPLIVHVADIAAAERIGVFDAQALKLAQAFWPGPLTVVLRRRAQSGIAELATAGLDTVALRVPSHATARALIAAAERPLAAPSANKSGRLSPTTAADVAADFGPEVALILDGGAAQHGLESTVVEVSLGNLVLLRPGAVTVEAIAELIGRPPLRAEHAPVRPSAPGQFLSHYAPDAAVRLDIHEVRPGEALLAFGPTPPYAGGPVFNLSPTGDLVEAAAQLFAGMRELDKKLRASGGVGPRTIAVMTIPEHGLGAAINDRLRRAAAPR